jgi:hypothetical protein
MSIMATEYMPMFKLLGNRVGSGYSELHQESVQNLDIDTMCLDDEAMEISDDEIEDW